MAKKPKKETLGKIGRVEREQRQTQIVIYGAAIVVISVVVILLAGTILQSLVWPNQPVAVVNGEEILTRDFQARVRYERQRLVNNYLNYFQYYQAFQGQDAFQSQYLSMMNQIQYQLDGYTAGKSVLDGMIEEIVIRDAAAEMGITVTDEEIAEMIEIFFGFFPSGFPTETVTPTTVPVSTLSATQLALATLVPTVTATLPPTATEQSTEPTVPPEPTATPILAEEDVVVAEPTATEVYTREQFEEDKVGYFDYLGTEIQVDEDDLRALLTAQLLRSKVRDALTADLPREQEQVWARHLLVEDEALAIELLARIEAGEDFGALALEYSLDTGSAERGGDLGWFNVTTMVPDFTRVAFNTPVGTVSDPLQTAFGWHLIQVMGHEFRPLSPDEYESYRDEQFSTWLESQFMALEVEYMEYWEERIPVEPSIPVQAQPQLQPQQ